LLREPTFEMSYTIFKDCDTSSIVNVLLSSSESDITFDIPFVNVDTVQLQLRFIPPFQRKKVFQKFSTIVDAINSPRSIMEIGCIIFFCTTSNTSCDTIKQTSSM